MDQQQAIGIFRHILTTLGGVIVAKGYTDESTMTAIVGGAVALAGFIWSYVKNKKGAKVG